MLGKETISAIIDVSDAEMAAFSLAENIDRTDLTAYEIAVAIKRGNYVSLQTSLASSLD